MKLAFIAVGVAIGTTHWGIVCRAQPKATVCPLANKLLRSVWFVLAVHTTDYWGQVGRIARITIQSALKSLKNS